MLTSLSIVIPAFNEEASIAQTVTDALAIGSPVAARLEVIVCNDGSRDGTAAAVHRCMIDDPRVRLIDRATNRGIEASIRLLYAASGCDWVFLMSADRQWPMTCLPPMVVAAANADIVVGIRENKRAIYSPYRRALSWTYEHLVRGLGAPVGDPGSIKLGRRALLDVELASRGVFSEGERLVRAARAGARVVGVPVEFHSRKAGKATGARARVVIDAGLDVARVGLWMLGVVEGRRELSD